MDFAAQRERMVAGQLVSRGITDARVLDAFRKVPRHEFVNEKFLPSAYDDHPLPIGEGQTISQPFMTAIMTQCLNLTGGEKVLEIGAGSGYQAAILAKLAQSVYTVERIPGLARSAMDNLNRLGYENVKIKTADGTLGWKEFSPYDAIIVTAGAPKIPTALINQLNDRGRLVIPVGGSGSQTLTLVEKEKNCIRTTDVLSCVFVPLIGKNGWGDGPPLM